ncbi:hypothetical protein [Tianweitania sediminis]|uniref:Phage integrase family protein n=1 Tax=Tianweitania sediminis TaxID=1502156 RepID=A0A8J7QWR2_9HYPH|nr:hypothetical protein [Tianweitania sediminis]MBP0438053.1 hypothetical protein [Tianweitania sediminis]
MEAPDPLGEKQAGEAGALERDGRTGDAETTVGCLVIDFPYLLEPLAFDGRTSRKTKLISLPVLAVRVDKGEVVVPDEALNWSRHLARNDVPHKEIRRRLNSVGRLFEFVENVLGELKAVPGAMDLSVWEYLMARISTPHDLKERLFDHWQPVGYTTVLTEFRDLVDFARYCGAYTGSGSMMASAFRSSSDIWLKVDRKLVGDDLLSHLNAQRQRWHDLLGEDRPMPPRSLKKAARKGVKKSDNSTTMSIDQVESLIDGEKNPVFKATWMELAYLGPRISELLNQWRCDVLDASYAPRLFEAPVAGPLVIFADPRKSTYTGSMDLRRNSFRTREQVLAGDYGLLPRPDELDAVRAGHKGMSVFNAELQITHGTWTCLEKAAEYELLVQEILHYHRIFKTDHAHPYLFINVRNAEYRGEPSKIGNMEKAFDRACVRVGIRPHEEAGAHLHGLRHFYRWYAKEVLKASPEIMKLMLRQESIDSQFAYGKHAEDGNNAMLKLRDGARSHRGNDESEE